MISLTESLRQSLCLPGVSIAVVTALPNIPSTPLRVSAAIAFSPSFCCFKQAVFEFLLLQFQLVLVFLFFCFHIQPVSFFEMLYIYPMLFHKLC